MILGRDFIDQNVIMVLPDTRLKYMPSLEVSYTFDLIIGLQKGYS